MTTAELNVYSCRTMIGNWWEERELRQKIIDAYADAERRGELKCFQIQQERENVRAPAALSEAKLLFDGDRVLVICHNERALMLASDPRYPNKDFTTGARLSWMTDVAPMRRSVFTIRRAAAGPKSLSSQSLLKYGNRLKYMLRDDEDVAGGMYNAGATGAAGVTSTAGTAGATGEGASLEATQAPPEPVRYGERVRLVLDRDLVKNAGFYKDVPEGEDVVVGCVRVFTTSVIQVVAAPARDFSGDEEFVIEPFHAAMRLEMEGRPVPLDAPVVLRHRATGQCLGTGERMMPAVTDFDKPEYVTQCKSVLNQYRREEKENLITLTVGNDTFDEK